MIKNPPDRKTICQEDFFWKMMGANKTFIIGDIHGQLGMLENLMAKIPWRPGKDALIFLGDYVDRGPDAKGVVDYLLSLTTTYSNIHCILGNHEGMLLDYLAGINKKLYLANGGGPTLRTYQHHGTPHGTQFRDVEIPEAHLAFYNSLEHLVALDGYYLVHAGFRPGISMTMQTRTDMLWIREPFISSDYDFGKKVVFGHTPFEEPLVMKNKIGIDTGAAYGRRLCCLELPAERFYFAGV
ncbi:Ser/Thr phosphatase family protein [delta proteobacterium NaphS2]|nr:Ser/Thr phosphatase family protein [delta proteobacterium NaphS2]